MFVTITSDTTPIGISEPKSFSKDEGVKVIAGDLKDGTWGYCRYDNSKMIKDFVTSYEVGPNGVDGYLLFSHSKGIAVLHNDGAFTISKEKLNKSDIGKCDDKFVTQCPLSFFNIDAIMKQGERL